MSKRLLFVGVSTMRDHAGQHKLYFIADALARRGIPVSVLVPDLSDNRNFLAGRSYIEAIYYPPGSVLGDVLSKARALREGAWSAVWIVGVGLRSFVLRTGAARGLPLIKDFDEFPSMIESFGPLRRAYLRLMERLMIAQADGFTCASAYLADSVRARRPQVGGRLLQMPVAISEEEHRVDPALVARLRAGAGSGPVLIYIGSLNRFYEDQIAEIIGLAKVLRQRGSVAQIWILGGGPDRNHFEAKVRDAETGETLQFLGGVDRAELASYMEAAQVLLFPFPATPFNLSRCPTKAFHYAAANRPVVTNRTGEVAALLGETALYYPERDLEAFADACEAALAAGPGFDNRIPFASLTWETRSHTFADWLSERGWLPAAARPEPARGAAPVLSI